MMKQQSVSIKYSKTKEEQPIEVVDDHPTVNPHNYQLSKKIANNIEKIASNRKKNLCIDGTSAIPL